MISPEVAYAAKNNIDIHHLLETMIFHKKIKLFTSRKIFSDLIQKIGVDSIVELSELEVLEINLVDTSFGGGRIPNGLFMAGKFGEANVDKESLVEKSLKSSEIYGSFIRAPKAKLIEHIEFHQIPEHQYELVKKMFSSTESAIEELKNTNISIPESLKFKRLENSFFEVSKGSDHDFSDLMIKYGSVLESLSYGSNTAGSLMANFFHEVHPSVTDKIKRAELDEEQVANFHTHHFKDYLRIKESLDAGALEIPQAISLAKKSRDYAHWASGNLNPELVSEYTRELKSENPINGSGVMTAVFKAATTSIALQSFIPSSLLALAAKVTIAGGVKAVENSQNKPFKKARFFVEGAYESHLSHISRLW